MTSPVSDQERLVELILLTAGRLQEDPTYGATKLNKALFLSDFLHYKRHGQAVSGASYLRLPRAPAPRGMLEVRQNLVDRGEARLEVRSYLGHVQERLLPNRPAESNAFGETEVLMVSQVCEALRGHSHTNLLGWQLTAEREEIPYESAFLSTTTPTKADIERASTLGADLGLLGSSPQPRRRPGGPERAVSHECSLDALLATYPRATEVLAGIAWACGRWPEGAHRIPGTRLHLLKTEWPIPSLGTWFTLENDGRCTIWAIDEIMPYAPEEDGTD